MMSVIEDSKELAKVAQDIQHVELHKKIITGQGELFELHEENRELRRRLEELERMLGFSEELTFKSNFYGSIRTANAKALTAFDATTPTMLVVVQLEMENQPF